MLILASASPRRRDILIKMNVPFEVDVSEAEEAEEGAPEDVTRENARRKAEAVAARRPGETVLAADTLVALDGEILGKPADEADARRMLRRLSGRTHEVLTGVYLIDGETGTGYGDMERSSVRFQDLTEERIDEYVSSGEPMGKAGAYAIQGLGGSLVAEWHGSYTNIIGLPEELVGRMLAKLGGND